MFLTAYYGGKLILLFLWNYIWASFCIWPAGNYLKFLLLISILEKHVSVIYVIKLSINRQICLNIKVHLVGYFNRVFLLHFPLLFGPVYPI